MSTYRDLEHCRSSADARQLLAARRVSLDDFDHTRVLAQQLRARAACSAQSAELCGAWWLFLTHSSDRQTANGGSFLTHSSGRGDTVGSPGQKTQSKSRDATSSSNTSPMIAIFERPVAAGTPLAAPSLFALLTGVEAASKPVHHANRTGPSAGGSAAPEGMHGHTDTALRRCQQRYQALE